jgi:hypothetical protein
MESGVAEQLACGRGGGGGGHVHYWISKDRQPSFLYETTFENFVQRIQGAQERSRRPSWN